MKVAYKGELYHNVDVAYGKRLQRDLEAQGVPVTVERRGDTMTFVILVPDDVSLASDVYP